MISRRAVIVGAVVGTVVLGATAVGVMAEVPTPTPGPGWQRGGGFMAGMRGAMGGRSMMDADWSLVGAAAKLTGLSQDEVIAQRRAGKSFAQIVESKGKKVSDLISAVMAGHKQQLDAAVAAQRLTQAQADAAYKQMEQRITEAVTSTAQMQYGQGTRPGGYGRGRMQGHPCLDDDAPQSTPTAKP